MIYFVTKKHALAGSKQLPTFQPVKRSFLKTILSNIINETKLERKNGHQIML